MRQMNKRLPSKIGNRYNYPKIFYNILQHSAVVYKMHTKSLFLAFQKLTNPLFKPIFRSNVCTSYQNRMV